MMFVSPLFLQVAINKETLQKKTLWTVLGLRREGMCQAVALPLLLTATLFAGPLCMQIFNGTIRIYAEPHYWTNNLRNLVWLKIHLVAPLSEEFTFRSCMLPLLLQCFRPSTAIFLCPFFFGLAHFHHMIPRMKQGFDLKTALFVSCKDPSAFSRFFYLHLFRSSRTLLANFVFPFRFPVLLHDSLWNLLRLHILQNGSFLGLLRGARFL